MIGLAVKNVQLLYRISKSAEMKRLRKGKNVDSCL